MLNESEIIRTKFSLVHYNVQSALHKLDILKSKLSMQNKGRGLVDHKLVQSPQ